MATCADQASRLTRRPMIRRCAAACLGLEPAPATADGLGPGPTTGGLPCTCAWSRSAPSRVSGCRDSLPASTRRRTVARRPGQGAADALRREPGNGGRPPALRHRRGHAHARRGLRRHGPWRDAAHARFGRHVRAQARPPRKADTPAASGSSPVPSTPELTAHTNRRSEPRLRAAHFAHLVPISYLISTCLVLVPPAPPRRTTRIPAREGVTALQRTAGRALRRARVRRRPRVLRLGPGAVVRARRSAARRARRRGPAVQAGDDRARQTLRGGRARQRETRPR